MDWNAVVGRNVRVKRQALGLTQEQVAHDAEMTLRHLGSIERGKQNPSLATLVKISKVLGCSPRDLLVA